MKRICSTLLACLLLVTGFTSVQAEEVGMYVNNTYVYREFDTIGRFDMVPILDIAGELGFENYFDGQNIYLYSDKVNFTFTMGSADVYDHEGNWYGLDVVPQFINGRVMIPANFLIYNMGTPYTWDDVTKTLFINSDATYQWLISTPEHQKANPKYMARVYYDTFRYKGTLTSYGGDTMQYRKTTYPTSSLYYYMADVNYDGTLDLVVADESTMSNGVIVYTYRNGSVYPIYQPGMPYSSGVVRLTLATYDGQYGILRYTQHSLNTFSYWRLSPDGKEQEVLSGYGMDDEVSGGWRVNHSSYSKEKWISIVSSIQPVQFYSLWDLEAMAY